jgi:hypothetical protein
LHAPPSLSAVALIAQPLAGLERGGEFVGSIDAPSGAHRQLLGKTVGSGTHARRRTVGMTGSTDDQGIREVLEQKPIDSGPVHTRSSHHHSTQRRRAAAQSVARGDTDATQTEIERE